MTEAEQLRQSLAALEAQRAILGDAIIEPAITALREKLAALENSRPAAAQSRKQATILFADISGFTAMSETRDAEDVTEMMNTLWARIDAAITAHAGIIDKHIGDAVMALWGAGETHEDDPERAIRAALTIQKETSSWSKAWESNPDTPIAIRIGINTGPVLFGEIGLTHEFTAMGDTVNTAYRLQQAAPPGGILIAHTTYSQVRGLFEVQRQTPLNVKGKTEPLQTYLISNLKPRAFRLRNRGVEGIETRMIGRDAELERLQNALETMLATGQQQMLTIVGEAGVGKSRLLYEFNDWLELSPKKLFLLKSRAAPEMQNRPYALFHDLLCFRFQIQDNDPPLVVREKIEQGLAAGAETPAEQAELLLQAHFIGHLLGFDFNNSPHIQKARGDARQIHDRALIYLQEFLQRTATRFPIIIFFEDIHWADDGSLQTIQQLSSFLNNVPIFILNLTRPSLFERWPQWGIGRPYQQRLELQPLSNQDGHRLVDEILQKATAIPPALHDMVIQDAGGNPFYIEELIKILIEDKIILKGEESWSIDAGRLSTIRVPPTLAGILQARLDSLPTTERQLLQGAAIVGRVFWDDTLSYLNTALPEPTNQSELQQLLTILGNKEMIFHRPESTFVGAREYIFKHAILREVAYESILKRTRRIYHALVAEWLIQHSSERAAEYTSVIARHLELAGQTLEAITYLRYAGEQAAARFANAEALADLTHALELLPETNVATRTDLLLIRENVYDILGNRTAQAQDLAQLAELTSALAVLEAPATAAARRAELALRQAGYAYAVSDFAGAVVAAQTAIQQADLAGDPTRAAAGYCRWGMALWRQGDLPAANPPLQQALSLARSHGAPQLEADSLRILGNLSYYQGDYTTAQDYFEHSLLVSQTIGDRRGSSSTLNNLGEIARSQGKYGEAIQYYEQRVQIAREIGDRDSISVALANLSLVAHNQGDNQTARICAEEMLDITRAINNPSHQAYALTNLGHALTGLQQLPEAVATYQQAVTLRRELNEHFLAMESLAGLARAFQTGGNKAQAKECVEEILTYLQDHSLDGTDEPLRIYLTCYQILSAAADPRAPEILDQGYRQLQAQAAAIPDPTVRRSFLENVAAHRELARAWENISTL